MLHSSPILKVVRVVVKVHNVTNLHLQLKVNNIGCHILCSKYYGQLADELGWIINFDLIV